jgi:hypothetical protein
MFSPPSPPAAVLQAVPGVHGSAVGGAEQAPAAVAPAAHCTTLAQVKSHEGDRMARQESVLEPGELRSSAAALMPQSSVPASSPRHQQQRDKQQQRTDPSDSACNERHRSSSRGSRGRRRSRSSSRRGGSRCDVQRAEGAAGEGVRAVPAKGTASVRAQSDSVSQPSLTVTVGSLSKVTPVTFDSLPHITGSIALRTPPHSAPCRRSYSRGGMRRSTSPRRDRRDGARHLKSRSRSRSRSRSYRRRYASRSHSRSRRQSHSSHARDRDRDRNGTGTGMASHRHDRRSDLRRSSRSRSRSRHRSSRSRSRSRRHDAQRRKQSPSSPSPSLDLRRGSAQFSERSRQHSAGGGAAPSATGGGLVRICSATASTSLQPQRGNFSNPIYCPHPPPSNPSIFYWRARDGRVHDRHGNVWDADTKMLLKPGGPEQQQQQ